MNLWTPGNLVRAKCPVSHNKHHIATSKFRQLGLSTPGNSTHRHRIQASQITLDQAPPDRTYRASFRKLFHPFTVKLL